MSAMAVPVDPFGRQLLLLAELVTQQRRALGISSKEKAAERCGLSHMTYRNVEAGQGASPATYAKIETAFGMDPGSCKAVLDGADTIRLVDGTELTSAARSRRPSLEGADEEIKAAITKAVSVTTPELTFSQAEELTRRAIEELRERGVLPPTE